MRSFTSRWTSNRSNSSFVYPILSRRFLRVFRLVRLRRLWLGSFCCSFCSGCLLQILRSLGRRPLLAAAAPPPQHKFLLELLLRFFFLFLFFCFSRVSYFWCWWSSTLSYVVVFKFVHPNIHGHFLSTKSGAYSTTCVWTTTLEKFTTLSWFVPPASFCCCSSSRLRTETGDLLRLLDVDVDRFGVVGFMRTSSVDNEWRPRFCDTVGGDGSRTSSSRSEVVLLWLLPWDSRWAMIRLVFVFVYLSL